MLVYNSLHLVISVLVAFLVDLVRKYIHEKGHKSKYKKFGISAKITIIWNELGKFSCQIDKNTYKKFNKLSLNAKKEILLVGPKIDITSALIFVLLFFIGSNLFKLSFIIMTLLSTMSFVINISKIPQSDYWNYLNLRKEA